MVKVFENGPFMISRADKRKTLEHRLFNTVFDLVKGAYLTEGPDGLLLVHPNDQPQSDVIYHLLDNGWLDSDKTGTHKLSASGLTAYNNRKKTGGNLVDPK